MDNRAFISRFAQRIDRDPKETARLVAALCEIIGHCASECDNVALPGFGTFEANKTAEYVAVNPSDGARILMPPAIKVSFRPGSHLKKAVSKS